jgi:hypothetical protein
VSASPASLEASPSPFPPAEIGAFLRFCAGEWLALRSCFASAEEALASGEETWHSAERAELQVAFLEPEQADHPGGLVVTPPAGGQPRRLHFGPGLSGELGWAGSFRSDDQEGQWQLWPDGSLELRLPSAAGEVRERIWFTKPNLRLRSCVEHGADGSPGRVSFSSEIRRIARPAAGAAG